MPITAVLVVWASFGSGQGVLKPMADIAIDFSGLSQLWVLVSAPPSTA